MRRGMIFSSLLHLLILVLVIFGLPRWNKQEEVMPSIPVEIVTHCRVTRTAQGGAEAGAAQAGAAEAGGCGPRSAARPNRRS